MMSPFNKISFIGAGNVAFNYVNVLKNNGIYPNFVLVRNENKLLQIQNDFGVKATAHYDDILDSDMIIVAVNDEAIKDVASNLIDFKGIVVHTSGTQPSSVLNIAENYGVLYPLQTMTKKNVTDFEKVPLLITASSSEVLEKIHKFAEMMSENVVECSDEDRRYIHLSAVFVCNFVNLMLQIGGDLIEDKGFEISVFRHLVDETIDNAFAYGAKNALTGPARRGDMDTINKHLSLLKDKNDEKKIYEMLTDFIINKYK